MIDGARVRAGLAASGIDATVEVSLVTESTNDDAKRAAASGGAAPAIFLAEEQTRGRGRSGSAWLSRAGESILMSVLLRPRLVPSESAKLTLAAGAAVAELLAERLGSRVTLKWPNDVLCDGLKIAGILVEGQTRGLELSSIVVGVGLNVESRMLPPELEPIATSLALSGERDLDRTQIAIELARAIVVGVSSFEARGLTSFLEVVRARDALAGARVSVGDVSGTAHGIDDEGRLLVLVGDGTVVPVVSGHVVREPSPRFSV